MHDELFNALIFAEVNIASELILPCMRKLKKINFQSVFFLLINQNKTASLISERGGFVGLRPQLLLQRYPASASAPATISRISPVIAACLRLLYSSRNAFNISPALSVALFIAVMRAPCSDACESSSAL